MTRESARSYLVEKWSSLTEGTCQGSPGSWGALGSPHGLLSVHFRSFPIRETRVRVETMTIVWKMHETEGKRGWG